MGGLAEICDGIAFVPSFANVLAFATSDGLVLVDTASSFVAAAVHGELRRWAAAHRGVLARPHRPCSASWSGGAARRARLARAGRDRARGAACQVRPVHHDGRRLQRGDQPAPVRCPGLRWPGRVPLPGPYLPGPASRWTGFELLHEKGETDDHTVTWVPGLRGAACGTRHLGVAQRPTRRRCNNLPQGVGRVRCAVIWAPELSTYCPGTGCRSSVPTGSR